MRKQDFYVVNSDKFVNHYIDDFNGSLSYQNRPIQIYPLSVASSLLKIPTALFRAEFNFLLIFSAGGGTQQIYNEVVSLTANDVLFVREGHITAITSVEPNTEGFFIHINNSFLPQFMDDNNMLTRLTFQPKLSLSAEDTLWVCTCADLIYQSNSDSAQEISKSLLRGIFLKLGEVRQLLFQPAIDRLSKIGLSFKELLYQNFINERRVKFYAEKLAVSENYLNRCVHAISGKSSKEHINEVVIYYSQVLLQNTDKDISEIAFELNFSDSAYFGRLFKQVTGLTPSEYRRSISPTLP